MSDNKILVRMSVNGRKVERLVEARLLLADFLRSELRLTGTMSAARTASAAPVPS